MTLVVLPALGSLLKLPADRLGLEEAPLRPLWSGRPRSRRAIAPSARGVMLGQPETPPPPERTARGPGAQAGREAPVGRVALGRPQGRSATAGRPPPPARGLPRRRRAAADPGRWPPRRRPAARGPGRPAGPRSRPARRRAR